MRWIFSGLAIVLATPMGTRAQTTTIETMNTARMKKLEELSGQTLSPELRATLVERWQHEGLLTDQTHKNSNLQDNPHQGQTSKPTDLTNRTNHHFPAGSVQAELEEMEVEMVEVMNDIEAHDLTPEERTTQIDQLHQLNREFFKHILTLNKTLAAQRAEVDQPTEAVSGSDGSSEPQPMSDDASRKHNSILLAIKTMDPEERTRYVEVNSSLIEEMGRSQNLINGKERSPDSKSTPSKFQTKP